MNNTTYSIVLVIFEVIFSAILLACLRKVGLKKTSLAVIASIFVSWLLTIYTLISKGFFSNTGVPQLSFSLAVVIPVLLGYLLSRFYIPLQTAVEAMSTRSFLKLQYWRAAFGFMFFLTPVLPMWFKCIGGLGDIAAGLSAFLAVTYFRNHPDRERQTIIRGNLVGILDFIVVFALGVGIVLKYQSPDMIFDLIPLYVVPLFMLLHIFSMRLLWRKSVKL